MLDLRLRLGLVFPLLGLCAAPSSAEPTPQTSQAARRAPGHPQTLASPHVPKEHGGLDIRVRPGRVVVRSYVRTGTSWHIEHRAVPANIVEDAGAAAARDAFHAVRRAMMVHGHWKLGDAKIVDTGFDEAVARARGGATQLSELYSAATDGVVKELKTIDRWANILTPEAFFAHMTPPPNNVTAHRLPGDVLAVKVRLFSGLVADQMRDALAAARAEGSVRGLILDLRGNPGGSVAEAHGLLSQFMPAGQTLLTTEHGRLGRPRKLSQLVAQAPPGGPDTALPIAALVDGKSASSSELTAGVFKDSGRARLFGDKTHGKGVGQLNHHLPDGRFFLQTEWRRVLPRLGPYHGIGIFPDVDTAQARAQVDAAAQGGRLRARGDLVLRAALLSLWPASPN